MNFRIILSISKIINMHVYCNDLDKIILQTINYDYLVNVVYKVN